MAEIRCRHFNGYKPCGLSDNCERTCEHFDEVSHHIVIIHLGALGAVLRSTALLPAIRRTFRKSIVTWVTDNPAQKLLEHNPLIDRILTTSADDQLALRALRADVVLCIDKSLRAVGLSSMIQTKELRGFKADAVTGAILPANEAAKTLWGLGLSNNIKFFENKKTETQLVHEALELGEYLRDEYLYKVTPIERDRIRERRLSWAPGGEHLIGVNTGASPTIPYKKLSVEFHRRLIVRLKSMFHGRIRIVLLGGKDEEPRNRQIAEGLDVIQSRVDLGIRDGMISVAACDSVLSGDSLGLHMAIAQKKWCVAWFGPTCHQEVDLYDRGIKVLTKATCSPCWKRVCDKSPMCYDLVDLDEVAESISKGFQKSAEWLNSLSKPRFPETSSSASP